MDGRRAVVGMFRDHFDGGDPWGSAMGWLFPMAELLRRSGDYLWAYHPSDADLRSPDRPADYGDDYVVTMLWDDLQSGAIDVVSVRYAYRVVDRYANWLEVAGLNY